MSLSNYHWTPLFAIKDGHRYFRAEDGRIAIADQSGMTPESTDDGVLFVDTTKPLAAGDPYFSIPLLNERGEECRAIAAATEALRLADITGQSILAPGGLVFGVSHQEPLLPEAHQANLKKEEAASAERTRLQGEVYRIVNNLACAQAQDGRLVPPTPQEIATDIVCLLQQEDSPLVALVDAWRQHQGAEAGVRADRLEREALAKKASA